MIIVRRVFVAMALLLSFTTAWAEVPTSASKEVSHLVSYLSSSGCQFYRNGTWHDAAAARAHLEKKYNYLLEKDLVKTAEDFIRLGATESSLSHEPYKVRCGEQEQSSQAWLNAELLRYRQAESSPVP